MNIGSLSNCKHQNSLRERADVQEVDLLVLWRSTNDCGDKYFLEGCHA